MASTYRPGDATGMVGGLDPVQPLSFWGKVSRGVPAFLILTVLASCLLILLITGQPGLAAGPAIGGLFLTAIWTQPVRRTLVPLTFAQLFFFHPAQGPDGPLGFGFLWKQVHLPGYFLTNMHLNKSFGTSFMPFSGHELAYVALFCLLVLRQARGDTRDSMGRKPVANIMIAFLLIELLAVIAFEGWGMLNHGNFKSTLFQIRHFLLIPLEAVVLCLALRDSRDFLRLAIVATIATLLKGAVGLYFLFQAIATYGYQPPFMTGHEDSVMFVLVMFMWIVAAVHTKSWQRILMAAAMFIMVALIVYYNNRRLAWVSLVAAFIAFFPLLTGKLRRRVNLTLILLAPLVFVYLMLAKTHTEGIFAPGADLMGIANVTDGSSQWRVLENANLIYTIQQHQFLGTGFGHEWIEVIRLPDISTAFAEYRLTAHNSVLWLLGIVGSVGFTLIWMPIVVGVFLARRSYMFATTPYQRTAAATAIAAAVCYVNQGWGDIGLAAAAPTFFLSVSLALSAKLAHETGAWPEGARLFSLARKSRSEDEVSLTR